MPNIILSAPFFTPSTVHLKRLSSSMLLGSELSATIKAPLLTPSVSILLFMSLFVIAVSYISSFTHSSPSCILTSMRVLGSLLNPKSIPYPSSFLSAKSSFVINHLRRTSPSILPVIPLAYTFHKSRSCSLSASIFCLILSLRKGLCLWSDIINSALDEGIILSCTQNEASGL